MNRIVNTAILFEPMNWVIVTVIVMLAGMGLAYVTKSMTVERPVSENPMT